MIADDFTAGCIRVHVKVDTQVAYAHTTAEPSSPLTADNKWVNRFYLGEVQPNTKVSDAEHHFSIERANRRTAVGKFIIPTRRK